MTLTSVKHCLQYTFYKLDAFTSLKVQILMKRHKRYIVSSCSDLYFDISLYLVFMFDEFNISGNLVAFSSFDD